MSDHKNDCQCEICNHPEGPEVAIREFKEKQKKLIEKYGFVVHSVPQNENRINHHTHGLDVSYNHPDFQIVYPIHPETAHSIFCTLANAVKGGKTFHPDNNYSDIIPNYRIRLIRALENDRTVLRVILPDVNGNLMPGDFEDDSFAEQYI